MSAVSQKQSAQKSLCQRHTWGGMFWSPAIEPDTVGTEMVKDRVIRGWQAEGSAPGASLQQEGRGGARALHAPAPGSPVSRAMPPPVPFLGSPVGTALWGRSRLADRGRHRAGRHAPSLATAGARR